jgi:hypothetical protein
VVVLPLPVVATIVIKQQWILRIGKIGWMDMRPGPPKQRTGVLNVDRRWTEGVAKEMRKLYRSLSRHLQSAKFGAFEVNDDAPRFSLGHISPPVQLRCPYDKLVAFTSILHWFKQKQSSLVWCHDFEPDFARNRFDCFP